MLDDALRRFKRRMRYSQKHRDRQYMWYYFMMSDDVRHALLTVARMAHDNSWFDDWECAFAKVLSDAIQKEKDRRKENDDDARQR